MNGRPFFRLNWPQLVHRFTDYVHDATERAAAHGNADRTAEVKGLHAANHSVCGLHGDAAYPPFAQVLFDLEDYVDRRGYLEAVTDNPQCFINGRQVGFAELYVHGGTGDLNHMSEIFCHIKFRSEI